MQTTMKSPEEMQREFFARTAATYDAAPVHLDDEHVEALQHIVALARERQFSGFLDTGCGTGRALERLAQEFPGAPLCGTDLSGEMLEQGLGKEIPNATFLQCDSYDIPLPDRSFDAVCEFAVLHHVKHPNRVVKEMCRVARKAVFLSDHNRYGQGSLPERVTKLLLKKVGLIDFAYYVRTGGRGYGISEGDGISYSYSVFDSYPQLAEWADEILTIPIKGSPRYPLLTAVHVLVAAFRNNGPRKS